ncbi:MAG: hypothetical protein Q9197_003418, partial [Variospora fuerteventurae]
GFGDEEIGMVGLKFEERGCEGDYGGCVIGSSHSRVDLILLRFRFASFLLTHGNEFLLDRGRLLRRFLSVFIPRWCTGNLAAKRIRYTFCISDFWWSTRDGDERLQYRIDEDPADLPGIAAGNDFLLLLQGPGLFEAKILADERAFHHFHVAGISGREQCSECRGSAFNFLCVAIFEEFSNSGRFLAAMRCFGHERERMWERGVLPPVVESGDVL